MPAKRIIILERIPDAELRFRFIFWADVPAARQSFHAEPGLTSSWRGASVAENTALAAGQVIERPGEIAVRPGGTIAEVRTELEQRWTRFQNEVTNDTVWQRYGTHWTDAGAWVSGGA